MRMSKERFESVIEFIQDDITGDSRNRRPVTATEHIGLYVTLRYSATDGCKLAIHTHLMHLFTVIQAYMVHVAF